MKRTCWSSYLTMNAYYVGLSFLWNSLHQFVLLLIIPLMVGQARQGSANSILHTFGLVVAIIVMPAAGALSDRLTSRWGRRRPFMIAGTALDLLFLAGIALAFSQPLSGSGLRMPGWVPFSGNPDFWVLLLMYLGLQFSSNVANGPLQGLIPDLVPEEHRGVPAGIKAAIETVMVVVAAIVSGALLGRQGWSLVTGAQTIVGISAAVLLVTLAINVFGIREKPISRAEVPSRSVRQAIQRSFQISRERDPDYIWLLVSRLFFLAGVGVISNFGLFYFRDVLLAGYPDAEHLAPQVMGGLMLLSGMVIILITIPAGALSDRWGRKPFSALAGVAGVMGAALLLFVNSRPGFVLSAHTIIELLLAGLLLGIGTGLFNSTAWAWATDLVPEREAARYLGISNWATGGSQILANLGGFALDLFNARAHNSGFSALFLMGVIYFLLAIIVLPKVRETRGASFWTRIRADHADNLPSARHAILIRRRGLDGEPQASTDD